MIDIKYERQSNTTKVLVGNTTNFKNGKITAKFKNIITGEIHYQATLGENTWCTWCGAELITDVLFYDESDNLIYEHKWDIIKDGDEIEKQLWLYLKNRKNNGIVSNGLVIGTHDGRNGHWIYSIKDNLSSATLIDGSEKQFQELVKNYKNYSDINFKNSIVTVDGGTVDWYQGGEGYTDTVVNSLISEWLDESQITKVQKESISFIELTNNNNFDWIHLDVEGIDGDLILCLQKLPNIIVYESMNLDKHMESKLSSWFKEKNYTTIECNGNTIAKKLID